MGGAVSFLQNLHLVHFFTICHDISPDLYLNYSGCNSLLGHQITLISLSPHCASGVTWPCLDEMSGILTLTQITFNPLARIEMRTGWRIEKRRPAANGDAAQTQTTIRPTGLAGN